MKQALVLALSGLIGLQAGAARAEPSAAAPPSASAVDQAREHFQRGVEFYKDQSFDAALSEFTRAYDLAANYRILFNLGQVQLERHDNAAALKLFRGYLDGGGAEIPEQRREQVERDMATLKQRVAQLQVKCDVDGAEVSVEGVVVAKTPLAGALSVNPGIVHVSVGKVGYVAESRTFTLVGMESKDLVVLLEKAKSPVAEAPRARSEDRPPAPPARVVKHSKAPVWIGLGVTGALAVGAGALALRTRQANTDLDHELDAFPSNAGRISDARSQLKHYALATDVLAGSAVVAAGFTLYFALSSTDDAEVPRSKVGVRPWATGEGLEFSGNF